MENNRTIAPETIAQIKMYIAFGWVMVTGIASLFFSPFLILTLYFLFKACFLLGANYQNTFIEKAVFGPAKLAVAGFMISAGIPTDNNILAIVWVGMSLLFLASGCRNLFLAYKLGQEEGVRVPVITETARQRAKATKTEEALLSDLSDFLSDSPDKEA